MSVSRTPQQEAEENVILEQAAQIQAARKAEQAQLQSQRKAAAPPQPGQLLTSALLLLFNIAACKPAKLFITHHLHGHFWLITSVSVHYPCQGAESYCLH